MRVTITDNDFAPVTLSWEQASVSVDEDALTVTLQARATTTSDKMPESGFTVALSATTAGNTATQGSDYRRRAASLQPERLHAHKRWGSIPLPGNPGHQRLYHQ